MDVLIYDALRTPRGRARADGGLASLNPQDLVAQLSGALDDRAPGATAAAEALILGCVGQTGAQGGHIALVSKFAAGLPDATAALSLNNYCVSGLSAIGLAAARVATGQIGAALAGGVEMMSRVPFMADGAAYYTDESLPLDKRYVQVVAAADALARDRAVDRALLDQATEVSHARALAAEDVPALIRSRVAMRGPDGAARLSREEGPRAGMTRERLASLAPAFGEIGQAYRAILGPGVDDPRLTIAHAPPVADGAGLALVGRAGALGTAPRARILAFAEAGADPKASLTAGFAAMDQALARAGLSLEEMDAIEFMEAFAVTIALFLRDRRVDPDKVNLSGGHLAKGHPMGATGAILTSTLLDALDAVGGRHGLVVASGASGVGAAMVVERLA